MTLWNKWIRLALLAGAFSNLQISRAADAAFELPSIRPQLPNVLLIGDSISIGYTLGVRSLLEGEANVFRIPVNGGPTTRGLEAIDDWLGDRSWDVIHFNWGLHDLKFMEDGKRQVGLEDYESNLERLVARMQETGADLVWASTTPVPDGKLNPLRKPGDAAIYNQVAERVMRHQGIRINPLYQIARTRLSEIQRPANVHFTEEGSGVLAEQVTQMLRQTLTHRRLRQEAIQARSTKRPHFLVFIADDHGMNDLGCYGNPSIRTPHIDQLAREGMRFDRAFLTISSCSPTRSSILTGRYPHNTGAEDLHQPLPADQWTIARYLKSQDYERFSVGKWHLGNTEKQHWTKVVECQADVMADRCIEILRERDQSKPFFGWFASMDPHRGYEEGAIEKPHDPDQVVVPPYLPDHPKIRKELALYYDEIARFDEHIGRIRNELEAQGILDDTVIVYLSDNGMPFPRAKTTLYDSGIRTPFIVRWPARVKPGSHSEALISSIDLMPTLLDLAGVHGTSMQGQSFLPVLANPTRQHHQRIFAEANWHDFEQFTRSIRSDRFKLIRNYYWDTPLWNSVDSINSITWQGMLEARAKGALTPAQSLLFATVRPYEEFYVLDVDPDELSNQIDVREWQSEIHRLRAELDTWRIQTQDHLPEQRRKDGWTRDGIPLPHNQPWYDRYMEQGRKNSFEKF